MCKAIQDMRQKAFEEGFARGYERGFQIGMTILFDLVREGLITVERACHYLEMTEESFLEKMARAGDLPG